MREALYRERLIPSAICDTLRLVHNARRDFAADQNEFPHISDLAQFMFAFRENFETSFDSALEGLSVSDHFCSYEHELYRLWEDYYVPTADDQQLTWRSLDTISPSVLRSGRYHGPVESTGNDLLLRALGWRYLATQLVARQAFDNEKSYEAHLGEIEGLLVGAARTQRRILNRMLSSHGKLEGDLTALAVATRDDNGCDSFLVNVSELSYTDRSGFELMSLANRALSNLNTRNIHHCIIMTDNIESCSLRDIAQLSCTKQIQLIGNVEDIRFIIFVSDVLEQSHQPDREDVYEGRFRLDKSRLVDTFLRGRELHQKPASRYYPLQRIDESPALLFSPSVSFHLATKPSHREEQSDPVSLDDDGIISREKVAKRFFGYRSPNLDP